MRQAEFVAREVLEQRENGVDLKRQAVLFRTSSHSAPLELELARRNIPFVKFGGLKFQDAAHVKDTLSILRWIENPRERLAGFRALRLLPGIGPNTARAGSTRWRRRRTSARHSPRWTRPPRRATRGRCCATCAAPSRSQRVARDIEAVIDWYAPHLERSTTMRRCARPTSRSAPIAATVPESRALPDGAGTPIRRRRRAPRRTRRSRTRTT